MITDIENSYRLVSALFLRLLGVIYLIAFASLGVQIEGLAGSQGIIPLDMRLADFAAGGGIERYLQLPTLFWFNASDSALLGATILGGLAALLITFDRWTRPARRHNRASSSCCSAGCCSACDLCRDSQSSPAATRPGQA